MKLLGQMVSSSMIGVDLIFCVLVRLSGSSFELNHRLMIGFAE